MAEHTEISEVVISAASAEDAETILALQKLAYESEARFYGDWSIPPLTQTIQSLQEDLASGVVLKAAAGDRIVGSVRARDEGGTCRIGRLIVHPDFQGRGIGSRLLRAIEGSFPGAARFELFTGSESQATIRLYERHGYAVTRSEQQTPAVRITFLEKPGGLWKNLRTDDLCTEVHGPYQRPHGEDRMADYVLVHGAWHGGWCWKRVARLLRAAGHEVFTPTLTGLGERKHLMSPEIGLDTHIQDVIGVLEYEDLHDVILVGHSYAGMVVTGVAYRSPDRIAQLVYLDAFVPEEGRALIDYQPPENTELFLEKARTEGEGYMLPALIPPEAFGVTDEDDLAWVRPRMDPHPFKTKLDPVHLVDPRGAEIPRTFIWCNDPADIPFVQFAERARRDETWGYHELGTGHAAMITMPQEVAELLLELSA